MSLGDHNQHKTLQFPNQFPNCYQHCNATESQHFLLVITTLRNYHPFFNVYLQNALLTCDISRQLNSILEQFVPFPNGNPGLSTYQFQQVPVSNELAMHQYLYTYMLSYLSKHFWVLSIFTSLFSHSLNSNQPLWFAVI